MPAGKQISDNGVRFVHDPRGSKYFVFRTRIQGRQYQWGCGAVHGNKYKDAIERAEIRAEAIRQQLRCGTPPELVNRVSDLKEELTPSSSVRVVMETFLENKKLEWSNEKHIKQWTSPIERYMPRVLDTAIGSVNVDDAFAELKTVWMTKPETGSRIQQRLSQVFSYAIAMRLSSNANPFSREVIRAVLPSPRKLQPIKHHFALPFQEMPAIYAQLCNSDSISAYVTRWLMLTAGRSVEGRGALWSEIQGDVLTISAERMKSRREHRVPITAEMMLILERMMEWRLVHGTDLIFASPNKHSVLTDVAIAKSLKRYSVPQATIHGLRSGFKDWSTEHGWEDYWSEQQLAHSDPNKVRSAYRRSDVFVKRTEMMTNWSSFLAVES